MAASKTPLMDEATSTGFDDDVDADAAATDAGSIKDYFRLKILSYANVPLTDGNDPRDASADPMDWSEEKKAKVRAAIRADIRFKQTQARHEGKLKLLELPRNERKVTFGQLMEKHQQNTEKVADTQDTQLMPPPELKAVRKSNRKKGAETPAVGTPQFHTPKPPSHVITPKFDPNTPMGRQAMRLALPNETLVSLAGSPVHAGPVSNSRKVTRSQKQHSETPYVPVPVGDGKTLMVPLKQEKESDGEQTPLELSEEARENLQRLRANVDQLLLANAKK